MSDKIKVTFVEAPASEPKRYEPREGEPFLSKLGCLYIRLTRNKSTALSRDLCCPDVGFWGVSPDDGHLIGFESDQEFYPVERVEITVYKKELEDADTRKD